MARANPGLAYLGGTDVTKVYYKAVRPDGTDFVTGTTRPVVGKWMPRIEGKLVLCERGYHVSDEPGETLIGGSWPCRLFEVEIDEVVPYRNADGHKSVVHTYRPTRELPAWMALGPNGEEVSAIIERIKVLTQNEWRTLRRARYGSAWSAARSAAWNAAGNAAGNAAWNAAGNAAWDATWGAVVATMTRDLITSAQFDTLYEPWRQVVNIA